MIFDNKKVQGRNILKNSETSTYWTFLEKKVYYQQTPGWESEPFGKL